MKKGLSTDALQLVDWELSRGSVHLRGVSELFVAQLDEQERAVLKNAPDSVTVDRTFG